MAFFFISAELVLPGKRCTTSRSSKWRSPLLLAESVLSDLKDPSYSKLEGKRTIGSVIRICKAIHQQELADEIYNMHIYMYVCVCIFNHMFKKCFIHHQHQDPKDSSRPRFGLNVEPSMFQIKCNCCKGRKFPKRLK